MKYPWLFVGSEIMCIRTKEWESITRIGGFFIVGGTRPGPKFMETCIISDIEYDEAEPSGHEAGLRIKGYEPHGQYCICNFRPMEKIADEVTEKAKEPA